MTDQEINHVIAEFRGYKFIAFNRGWIACGDGETQVNIPDYCNDLNEMHELENTLYKGFIDKDYWQKGYGRFRNLLGELSTNPYSANARQRAEAFLRTIGKWKE